MSNLELIGHIEARWRPLNAAEKAAAQALIDDAWVIVNIQVPSLAAAQDSGALSTEVLRAVLSAMVLRVLRNPDGVRQWSVDDYSETRDSSVAAGALYLSDDELRLIGAAIGTRRRGAFSVAPGGQSERSAGSEWPHDPFGRPGYGW